MPWFIVLLCTGQCAVFFVVSASAAWIVRLNGLHLRRILFGYWWGGVSVWSSVADFPTLPIVEAEDFDW